MFEEFFLENLLIKAAGLEKYLAFRDCGNVGLQFTE